MLDAHAVERQVAAGFIWPEFAIFRQGITAVWGVADVIHFVFPAIKVGVDAVDTSGARSFNAALLNLLTRVW